MKSYTHKVNFYETDKMGITHHSNYIRFMEEAREDFLEKVGYGYARMESEGLISPTVSVNVEYKKPTTFNDVINIEVSIKDVTPVRSFWTYKMTVNGEVVCLAESTHCFIDKNGRPVSTKKASPEVYDLLVSLIEK